MIDTRWLTSSVHDLCVTFIETHDVKLLPILSDALIDAGCDDEHLIWYLQNVSSVGGAALVVANPTDLLVAFQAFGKFVAWESGKWGRDAETEAKKAVA